MDQPNTGTATSSSTTAGNGIHQRQQDGRKTRGPKKRAAAAASRNPAPAQAAPQSAASTATQPATTTGRKQSPEHIAKRLQTRRQRTTAATKPATPQPRQARATAAAPGTRSVALAVTPAADNLIRFICESTLMGRSMPSEIRIAGWASEFAELAANACRNSKAA